MADYNHTIIIGRLSRDPELRFLPSNTAVCNFDIATNRRWKDSSGQEQERVSFIPCKAFGRRAEVINQYLKKGRPLMVAGYLDMESWEKDGKRHSKLVLNVETFQFLDGGKREGGPAGEADTSVLDEMNIPFAADRPSDF